MPKGILRDVVILLLEVPIWDFVITGSWGDEQVCQATFCLKLPIQPTDTIRRKEHLQHIN